MEKGKLKSDMERNNRLGMTSHMLVICLMELLALLRCASNGCSVGYFILTLVVGFFSPLAEIYYWKKDHETPMIRHFLSYGFAVYFTLVIFTSTDGMLFFCVIPLLYVISVYNDAMYSLKINMGVIIESLVITIWGGIEGKFGYTTLSNAIVQNLVVILMALFSYRVAKTINQNSQQKMDKIKSLMENTTLGLAEITKDLNTLLESAESTKVAMEQVSDGTNNTAEAVQSQMLETNAIGEKTELVVKYTGEMGESVNQAVACVEQGRRDLHKLVSAVEATVESNDRISSQLSLLQENMKEMNKISKMIENIAFQTNILALNANVEAARAGEAGRGFAVVADEVSSMSNKTKESTEVITGMIGDISKSLNDVTESIKQISTEINAEKISAQESEASFTEIEKHTSMVKEKIESLIGTIEELTNANRGIVDSIQTISAVSEQVSALASEARNQEFENTNVLNHIAEAAGKLAEN